MEMPADVDKRINTNNYTQKGFRKEAFFCYKCIGFIWHYMLISDNVLLVSCEHFHKNSMNYLLYSIKRFFQGNSQSLRLLQKLIFLTFLFLPTILSAQSFQFDQDALLENRAYEVSSDATFVYKGSIGETISLIPSLQDQLTFTMTGFETPKLAGSTVSPARMILSNASAETISGSIIILQSAYDAVLPGVWPFVIDTTGAGVVVGISGSTLTITFNLAPGTWSFIDWIFSVPVGTADGTYTFISESISANGSISGAFTDDPWTWDLIVGPPDVTAPLGYSVTMDQAVIDANNADAVSFTFAGAEVGTDYDYTYTSSGGAGSVTGTGTIVSATDQISGIDLSGLPDGTITLSATLTDPSNNTGAAATDTATKDTRISASIDDPGIVEGNSGNTTLQFTVSLSAPAPAGGATVDFATSDGTAVASTDYTASAGTLSFAAGETTQTIDLTVIGDAVVERDENIIITLSNPTGTDVVIGDATGTGTITNDDTATITIVDRAVLEDQGAALITFLLDNAVDGGFTFQANTADNTARTADGDYTALVNELVTFSGTASEFEVLNLTITVDDKVEFDELVDVVMTNLTPTTVDANDVDITDIGVITLFNDDEATINLTPLSYTGDEDDVTPVTFAATLDREVVEPFSVDIATIDGLATLADGDYGALSASTLSFTGAANETQNFSIATIADGRVEGDEDFGIFMSNLNGTTLPIDLSQNITFTIRDDDTATLSIADVSVSEATGTVEVVVQLDNEVSSLFAVDVSTTDATAIAGDDYTAISGQTLLFDGAAGETQSFSVSIVNDMVGEADETFIVSMSNLVMTNSGTADITDVATITILNDDDTGEPTVESISRAEANPLNSNATATIFTVQFSEDVSGVDLTDFELVLTGTATGTLSGVQEVAPAHYTVNVNGISGLGTIGLNLVNDGSIVDQGANPLVAGFVGEVYSINQLPTSIELSNTTIQENNNSGDIIGVLSTTDPDLTDSHVYSLVSGTGDDDNASFSISGSNLEAAIAFDFETQSSYSLRLRSDDGNGGIIESVFAVTIENEVEISLAITGETNFGEVSVDESLSQNWQIANNGEGAAVVSLSSSSELFSFSTANVEIPVGETRDILISFNPVEAGIFSADLDFNTGTSNIVSVQGTGVLITDLNTFDVEEEIKIYPNPSSDFIRIDLRPLNGRSLRLSLVDISGKRILGREDVQQDELILNVTTIKQGIYLIRISDEESLFSKKVVIER